MILFDTDVQKLKYQVLKEVVKLESAGQLNSGYHSIPRTIIPGPKATMRCCIYHERAIVEERVKLAMGGDKDNPNIVEVISSACDECPVKRFSVTEACRGCIAHKCKIVCPVGAISTDNNRSVIDHERCIECGRCMKACPYSAIIESQRPCVKGCAAKAITIDKQKKATIDSDKCIRCGSCVYLCPFGVIVDKSYIVDVMRLLRESGGGKKYPVFAAVAPSFAGQFSYAKPGQIISGIKKVGFQGVVEAALGADILSAKEADELIEKGFLTSSCCPAFVSLVEKHFPDMASKISSHVSPMIETARWIKAKDKRAKVVFIGPCIAKKKEAQKSDLAGEVDGVLTFEELQALFDGMNIHVEALPESVLEDASGFGRKFAKSGGVSGAIREAIAEKAADFAIKPEICSGALACKVALLKASKGKLDANFIEGMACEGGCIGGAACLSHGLKDTMEIEKYGDNARKKSITASVRENSEREKC